METIKYGAWQRYAHALVILHRIRTGELPKSPAMVLAEVQAAEALRDLQRWGEVV